MKTEKVSDKTIHTYKGMKIFELSDGTCETRETVPVIGELVTEHKTLEAAKKYIDTIIKD